MQMPSNLLPTLVLTEMAETIPKAPRRCCKSHMSLTSPKNPGSGGGKKETLRRANALGNENGKSLLLLVSVHFEIRELSVEKVLHVLRLWITRVGLDKNTKSLLHLQFYQATLDP